MPDTDREQAAEGALLLHRLIPAPDHGHGFRRDPETGFVYYSSEWLSDEREDDDLTVLGYCPHGVNLDREFCPQGCRV